MNIRTVEAALPARALLTQGRGLTDAQAEAVRLELVRRGFEDGSIPQQVLRYKHLVGRDFDRAKFLKLNRHERKALAVQAQDAFSLAIAGAKEGSPRARLGVIRADTMYCQVRGSLVYDVPLSAEALIERLEGLTLRDLHEVRAPRLWLDMTSVPIGKRYFASDLFTVRCVELPIPVMSC
jgi:hypothetical protein